MKTIDNAFNELAYEYKTPSGLRVTIIHRPGFKKSLAAYGTPFGSVDLHQRVNGTDIYHKTGVAHFLEHKLFEDEEGDVFSKFAEHGANANAFTSYDQTVYYFSTNGDIIAPLGILIDFVSRFNITQEQVDKEKGIILEELRMYAKIPDMILFMKTYANVFHNHPLRIDIGGTEADVSAMLLEDLQAAYALNYRDSNMALVIISGAPIESIKETVDKHCQSHPHEALQCETVFEEEPVTVRSEYEEITEQVEMQKMSYSFKFKYDRKNIMFDEKMIRLLLDVNFSQVNAVYQTWLDDGIISDSFGYIVDLQDGFGVIYFFNDGDKPEAFKQAIHETMHHLTINEDDFDQLVRRHYGQVIMTMERTEQFALSYLSAQLKNVNFLSFLEDIKNVSYSDMDQYFTILQDFSESFLLMKPNCLPE